VKFIEVLSKYDKNYPKSFLSLKKVPEVIYAEGNLELLNKVSISIVGSRRCTRYGEKMSRKFAKELSKLGIVTVSGMALGVDTVVHEETIANGGKTIAVLPSGLRNIYPKNNIELYNKIIESGGLVISEYHPDTIADSKKFTSRNRLVSALGECIIITEAAYRSGTSITARYAREQGKKVFCVPSGLDNRCGIGTNRLIKNGDVLLSGISDIFEEINSLKFREYVEKYKAQKINEKTQIQIPEGCEKLYKTIREQPTSIDYIFNKLDEPISEISYKITLLELEGLINTIEGGFYERVINI